MKNPSYHRQQIFWITDEIRTEIAGAVAEVDLVQMSIVARLTVSEKYLIALSMMDAAERAGVLRLRRSNPNLPDDEAYRIVRSGQMNEYLASLIQG